ncbi:signal peptidase I [Frondihabitans sp. PhB188]|uniref:signal peptidase I n=1 Tax=Frondihabitans sp. PhB188 TaxID=2485200 RepID=UPI000F9CEA52|nr:signal peptidase I [Frondihabitans sp. PhB188]
MTDNSTFMRSLRRGLQMQTADGSSPVRGRRRAPDGEGGETVRRPGGMGRFLRDIVIIFLAALLISFLIKTFLVRSFYIPSASMENTLQINDRIIVNELVPNVVPLKRGDIIVFKDPGGWLSTSDQVSSTTGNPVVDGFQWFLTQVGLGTQDSDDHLVKRVIGLPGDKVACCNDFGQMTVNGVPLDEPYTKLPAGISRESEKDFSVTVPAGSLWVEGDNRYNSADSRLQTNTPSKGFVPESDVVGRAFIITWPLSRWTWLDDYPDVFRGTDSSTK